MGYVETRDSAKSASLYFLKMSFTMSIADFLLKMRQSVVKFRNHSHGWIVAR